MFLKNINYQPRDEGTSIVKFDSVEDAKKNGISESEESLYNYFIERSQNHLHVVFCMSPIDD
eukprot:UN08656